MVADRFGTVEEVIAEDCVIYRVQGTGFWIRWQDRYGRTKIEFFASKYHLDADSSACHFAEIIAGAHSTGEWAASIGTVMQEGLRVRYTGYDTYERFDLVYPQIVFFATVLMFTESILRGIPFEMETFGLAERIKWLKEIEEGNGGGE
ncbi:MAG: hypothetical protein PHW75_02310 [Patescibacteria group bacterium]|nr:hypothetical protein [Patescibacteria group bacterium]